VNKKELVHVMYKEKGETKKDCFTVKFAGILLSTLMTKINYLEEKFK